MYYAADRGYTDCVKELLAAGGTVDLPNANDRDSPLMGACSNGHVDTVKVCSHRRWFDIFCKPNKVLNVVVGHLAEKLVSCRC